MQDILQQIALPASRDSQVAFETSAEELIRRHESVLGGRSHAIRLAVDLLTHHLLPDDKGGISQAGLATLTFFSNRGSVQRLALEFVCPGVVPEIDALGGAPLWDNLRATVTLEQVADGSVEVRVSRRRAIPGRGLAGDELEVKKLRDAVWLMMLAKSWKSVSFHQREAGEVAVRLHAPKSVPRRIVRRTSA